MSLIPCTVLQILTNLLFFLIRPGLVMATETVTDIASAVCISEETAEVNVDLTLVADLILQC